MNLADLRCEYAQNPLGIEARAPRFSWVSEDSRRGQTQTAYQILVASDPEMLAESSADKWDSGKGLLVKQVGIRYASAALASRKRCYWKARAWDGEGAASKWSEVAWFEMGLLAPSDWQSLWLGHPAGFNGKGLYFRAFFNVDKPVKRARAYVAGLGLYEFYLNGVKATDHVLEPAQTDYASRVLYTTIDIGSLLREGRNIAGAIVGNRWHGAPKLRAQIHVEYTDGTSVVHSMQNTGMGGGINWMADTGPIVANAIYDGETYDARLERPGWCDPTVEPISGYNPKQFCVVAVPVDAPAGRMQAQSLEPMRVVQTLTPVTIREPASAPGTYVADMGQNNGPVPLSRGRAQLHQRKHPLHRRHLEAHADLWYGALRAVAGEGRGDRDQRDHARIHSDAGMPSQLAGGAKLAGLPIHQLDWDPPGGCNFKQSLTRQAPLHVANERVLAQLNWFIWMCLTIH